MLLQPVSCDLERELKLSVDRELIKLPSGGVVSR